MKPSKIFDIMDLTHKIRKQNRVFNPLFVGPPGIGKSEIIQQWCKKTGIPFIDLRLAYLEAPDVIGYPEINSLSNGRRVTSHITPEFWPSEGEGVILLDEVNRANTSMTNTIMQLLTDRRVHNYELPPGWMVVSCVNPETKEYDVNTMDAALKNRFEIFDVEYSKDAFVNYMKENDWDRQLVMFVESGTWVYTSPDKVAATPGSKYISPRNMSKLNAALKAGIETEEDELLVFESVLGRTYGTSFYSFLHNQRPVLFKEIKESTKSALKRLEAFCDPNNYKNSQISITMRDIIEDNTIEDELLIKVLLILPADQGPSLIRELEIKRKDDTLLKRLMDTSKSLHNYYKEILGKKK